MQNNEHASTFLATELADQAFQMDKLFESLRTYRLRIQGKLRIEPEEGHVYIRHLVGDLYETIPAGLPISKNLKDLQDYIVSESGYDRSFMAAMGRWSVLMKNLSQTAAPSAPVCDDTLFTVTSSANKEAKRSMQGVQASLRELVASYEASPESTRKHFPAVARAMKPYRVAVHAWALAKQLKHKEAPIARDQQKALQQFLDDPLHKEFLGTNINMKYLLTTAADNPKKMSSLVLSAVMERVAWQLALPATSTDRDYASNLSHGLKSDVKQRYHANSAHAVQSNPQAPWLQMIETYRWTLAADSILSMVESFQKHAENRKGIKPVYGKHTDTEQRRNMREVHQESLGLNLN